MRNQLNKFHKVVHHLPVRGAAVGQHHAAASYINVKETKDDYVIFLALPGMQRKDFSISISKRKLTISAEKKETSQGIPEAENQSFAQWLEIFTLPSNADTLMTAANYRNGALEIHIPKGTKNTMTTPIELYVY